ncbi:MAG: lysozyme inhibitor LprI family protein [Sideroxydans sp.]
MNRFSLTIFGCLLLTNADSASFDCTKAASKVEKLICSDPNLSKLDERLTSTYRTAIKNAVNRDLLRHEQKQWLLQRNECIDELCLEKAYATRTIQLLPTETNWPIPSIKTDDSKSCQMVAEHLNSNSLKELFAHPVSNPPSNKEIEHTFGGYAELGNYWTLDLNNDGIKDQLLILVDGSAHFTSIYALSGKTGASPVSMGTDIDEVANDQSQFDPLSSADVLSVYGRNYIFDGYSLWNLTQDGTFQTVCRFNEIGKPITNITIGNSIPVCKKILSSEKEIQHVQYALENGLGEPLPDEERFHMLSRGSDIVGALVDIDNDGEIENVVRLEYMFLGGRTCSAIKLAVTDSSASHIPETKLNELLLNDTLLNDLASHPCGPSLDMLIHDGTTYIDAIENDIAFADPLDKGGHTIYLIKLDKAEVICKSRVRVNVQAVGVRK